MADSHCHRPGLDGFFVGRSGLGQLKVEVGGANRVTPIRQRCSHEGKREGPDRRAIRRIRSEQLFNIYSVKKTQGRFHAATAGKTSLPSPLAVPYRISADAWDVPPHKLRGDQGGIVELLPVVSQPLTDLRDSSRRDPHGPRDFRRAIAGNKHLGDPALAEGQLTQPSRKINPQRNLVGDGGPTIFHQEFPPA